MSVPTKEMKVKAVWSKEKNAWVVTLTRVEWYSDDDKAEITARRISPQLPEEFVIPIAILDTYQYLDTNKIIERLGFNKSEREEKTMEHLNPLCPNCGEELTLCAPPDVDCTEDTVSVETEYECTKCGKSYVFRTEGKVAEWSEPIIEEE